MRRLSARLRLFIPPFSWVAVFYVFPLLLILVVSFAARGQWGGVRWEFHPANYARLLDPLYLKVFARSLVLTSAATLLCAVLAFPISWWMARLPRGRREVALLLVLIPFWTNILVRLYAWMFILGRGGLLNSLLVASGLVSEPLPILYTREAVLLGLVYGQLPFMVLPLYAALEKIDVALLEAARDLYATPWQAFRRVVLPLSKPGLVAGCILVFASTLCDFVTPDLLGGARVALIGNLIQGQYLVVRDWPFGSALALAEMALIGGGLVLYLRAEKAA
ncbi:MAG: ABC transporter permease [Elusimicrobiota bacterium]|jgi:spermidine/putrescine transport system permease protein